MVWKVTLFSCFKDGARITLWEWYQNGMTGEIVSEWKSENLAMIYFWLHDHKDY